MRRFGLLAATAATFTIASPAAGATTEIIDSAFSTCGTLDCSATSIAGYLGAAGASPQPWTAKILALRGNCLKLDVVLVDDPVPLEMVVVGPDVRVRWRSSGPGLPEVRLDPAPASGFYTVVVNRADGRAANTPFHLQFGQYDTGNVNCRNPTPRVR
jgi:hypothetical protein